MLNHLDDLILRFFREDVGGLLITDESGEVLYTDEKSGFVKQGNTNWASACPPVYEGQRGEAWDLLCKDSGKTYMVITSTMLLEHQPVQLHLLLDSSMYMEMYRDITSYSKTLKHEKDHDSLTGLYSKGKFMAMKASLFRNQETIAIFNMDVNNLKQMNDTLGHEMGDRLIRKAADSLRRIEARNVMPFRVGGDEFIVVALHVTREQAERLRAEWEKGLAELNQKDDDVPCVIACGFVYGEKGYDLDALFAQADQLMYEDKKAKKRQALS